MPLLRKNILVVFICGIAFFVLNSLTIIETSLGKTLNDTLNASTAVVYFEVDDPYSFSDISFQNPYSGFCSKNRGKTLDLIADNQIKAVLEKKHDNFVYCVVNNIRNKEIQSNRFSSFIAGIQSLADAATEKDGEFGYTVIREINFYPFLIGIILVFFVLLLLQNSVFRINWKDDYAYFLSVAKHKPHILFIPTLGQGLASMFFGTLTKFTIDIFSSLDFILAAPIVEEIVYRLFLFNLVKRQSNTVISSVCVSALFACSHGYDVKGLISVFLGGMLLQYLYVKYKSISVCICAHALHNLLIVIGMFA